MDATIIRANDVQEKEKQGVTGIDNAKMKKMYASSCKIRKHAIESNEPNMHLVLAASENKQRPEKNPCTDHRRRERRSGQIGSAGRREEIRRDGTT